MYPSPTTSLVGVMLASGLSPGASEAAGGFEGGTAVPSAVPLVQPETMATMTAHAAAAANGIGRRERADDTWTSVWAGWFTARRRACARRRRRRGRGLSRQGRAAGGGEKSTGCRRATPGRG